MHGYDAARRRGCIVFFCYAVKLNRTAPPEKARRKKSAGKNDLPIDKVGFTLYNYINLSRR